MYVCMCVHMHVYACVCIFACVCMYVCMHVYAYACVCMCMHVHAYVCICLRMHVYACVCICACVCMYACVFSILLSAIELVLTTRVFAPIAALGYKNESGLIRNIISCVYILLKNIISIAWLIGETYEEYLASGKDAGNIMSTVVSVQAMVGFITTFLFGTISVSLELATTLRGYHTFLRSVFEHNICFRCVCCCCSSIQGEMLLKIVKAQDRLRAAGENVPLDLERSEILRACNWRQYILAEDITGLFERIRQITDKEGNLLSETPTVTATIGFDGSSF
jgi:hypothetical protein